MRSVLVVASVLGLLLAVTPAAPITWRLRATAAGVYPLFVESSAGASHGQGVRITK